MFSKVYDNFIVDLKKNLATRAIGASSLRNQGASGVIDIARIFLAQLDISVFGTDSRRDFFSVLDKATLDLQSSFPENARTWGGARKAINLFLRDALYNIYLCDTYNLRKAESFFEVPLDSVIVEKLRSLNSALPKWSGLKNVKPVESARFQESAMKIAEQKGTSRIHLDVMWWADERQQHDHLVRR